MPRVPSPKGSRRNLLPALSRWRTFDNLRRSLHPNRHRPRSNIPDALRCPRDGPRHAAKSRSLCAWPKHVVKRRKDAGLAAHQPGSLMTGVYSVGRNQMPKFVLALSIALAALAPAALAQQPGPYKVLKRAKVGGRRLGLHLRRCRRTPSVHSAQRVPPNPRRRNTPLDLQSRHAGTSE